MLEFMITAASSNSGKTAVTCGLLSLLMRRGYSPCAFKCGPDYIDPMFHRSVLGIESRNLDVFLAGEDGVRRAYARGASGHDAAVCEGVMGFYDGLNGETASAWHVASLLEIPAILVVRPKGAALTLAAVIKGVKDFRSPSRICACIFNDCSETYYRMYGPLIEAESGVPVIGYLPHMQEADFESRHLGLMTAGEIRDLSERIGRIGERMEETIDWERLLQVAGGTARENAGGNAADAKAGAPKSEAPKSGAPVPIAVARDAAFSFTYAESIEALEDAGAKITYFSPISDSGLPEGTCGLYLPGGYPELYAEQLAGNESMRESVRSAVLGGLPTIAECGGFLYLSQNLADPEGNAWPMAGALPGEAAGTGKLVRFGYGTIGCEESSMLFRPGEQAPVHEFHYWDTSAPGEDLTLTKQSTGKNWNFGYASNTLYAGFPHLYLAAGPGGETLAARFVRAAEKRRQEL